MRRNKKFVEKRFYGLFIFVAALTIITTIIIIFLLAYIFNVTEVMSIKLDSDLGVFAGVIFLTSSIVVGLGISYGFGEIFMKPVRKIINGMSELSDGKYDVTIDLGNHSVLKELAECFNKLSQELKTNEIMSNDFINNFSHELKTPLVSINGLIELMKQPNFPEEKRLEYLQIIEEEANRLSSLTTNILNLSKLENQQILTNKNSFNVCEQIRTCVLLLEKKWTKKNLEFDLDFDEYNIIANEDLLKQVWFNLIDNAIKFSYNEKPIVIKISKSTEYINIIIQNEGPNIPSDELKKIFSKFYQVNKTHTLEGNGIGLSIVKKIIDLHEGSISVESSNNITKFIINLPI